MIRKIAIQNFRSFDPSVITAINFAPDKRVAFFYGLNGAGKSAIGQVVQSCASGQERISGCSVTTYPADARYEYLVYNERFIETHFRNRSDVPGIFTIGDPESSALEVAEGLEQELETWRAQRDNLSEQSQVREKEKSAALETALGAAWKTYTVLKDGPFKPWLPYGHSKQKFFDALQTKASTPYEGDLPSFDELAQSLSELGDSHTAHKPRIEIELPNFGRTEQDEIWTEPIVGSSDSALTALIRDIGNLDWVNQGRSYLDHSQDQCPFCQQSLPHDFPEELAKLFDASFDRRVGRATLLAENYAASVASLDQAIGHLIETEPFASENQTLALAWSNASRLLNDNAQRMASKVLSPQGAFELQPSQSLLTAVREAIDVVSNRVDDYNRRLSHRDRELKRIEQTFWHRLCAENDGTLSLYKTTSKSAQDALLAIQSAIALLRTQISEAEARLVELRAASSGTEEAVLAINARLQSLGVDSFRISRGEDDLYQLVRPGKGPDVYGSLSEGEKTLITFLYFVELITGSSVSNQSSPLDRKIVVIDDPISSLSHNFVYDIAATISRDIIALEDTRSKSVKQVIVLTHSLFFLNELIKVSKGSKNFELKRVLKKNYTTIVPMKIDDLKNDYEAWWQVVRDAYQDQVTSATAANAMRCILERFFYFTKSQQKFSDAMDKLAAQDRSFYALGRYLSHHSHGDANTLTDFGEYDVNYCLIKFKSVFDELGFTEHHRVMAGLSEAA